MVDAEVGEMEWEVTVLWYEALVRNFGHEEGWCAGKTSQVCFVKGPNFGNTIDFEVTSDVRRRASEEFGSGFGDRLIAP